MPEEPLADWQSSEVTDKYLAEYSDEYKQSRFKTNMRRDIGWVGAFFVAAGVPALILFSMGGISAGTGPVAVLVWTLSVLVGFVDAFVYAEIAGLHPKKSGGTAVHGATAWIRYIRPAAPVSLWCNWLAWTPVLALGSGLCAGYLLSVFFAADATINTWTRTIANLDFLKEGLTLRINAVFILGALIMLAVWNIQHYGILRTARVQLVLTIGAMTPLLVLTIVPLVTGDVVMDNFSPFVPVNGSWDIDGWTAFLGSFFIAAWSAYAFETAICYMSEFKNPGRDQAKAILWSGVFCIFCYTLIPFVWQGVLGTDYMLKPEIYSGAGVPQGFADMFGYGATFAKVVTIAMFFTVMLSVMTAMSGSSRTLFQGGQDGWLPKYLSHLNDHKVPTYAMWTDLVFNLFLLLMSDYVFVLAVSNCNYMIFNFLNLNAGWIHRKDNPKVPRPFKAPMPLFVLGTSFAYLNVFLLGAGANFWGAGTLIMGWISALIALPVFYYRHYVTDKGKFPVHMFDDLIPEGQTELGPTTCGVLPYVAVAGGLACMMIGYVIFWV
ncbi:MAG TPA: APC family permease [Thermoleophilia bacterium]|nr:APC family permease [Thermoleophilia bacterium]